jgi:trk system potassium uptake protein TrkA
MIDFIEFDDGFAIAKIHAPLPSHNSTLADSNIREKYGVTVVGLKRANEDFQHATPSTLILPGDLLIASGSTRLIQKFAGLAK